MANALIVDDERDIYELIGMALVGQSVVCTSASSIKSAIKKLKETQYDVIFCDICLPDGDGLNLLAHIQKHHAGTPVCLITAHGNMDLAIRALKLGAFDFINKPFELKQLRAVCRAALKLSDKQDGKKIHPTEQSKSVCHCERERLIGHTEGIKKVRDMVEKVARTMAPVFICGESGTGKEIVARAIHKQSNRRDGPFIAVNCGAIPETLLESEFFGYKKGAFTGANRDTDGLFVAAKGGTLFLDEIADLPLAMQVKLLRAIQERAVRPIGSDKEESVDVRILSATHQNLADSVKAGRFREDLYYRINVINIAIPPLRQRLSDLPELVEYLLMRLAKNGAYPQVKLSQGALDKLLQYRFPGNVRELENILERALTFVNSGVLSADDIDTSGLISSDINSEEDVRYDARCLTKRYNIYEDSFALSDYVQLLDNKQIMGKDADSKAHKKVDNLEHQMLEIERNLVIKALAETNNVVNKAAEYLGISARALRGKLKKLDINLCSSYDKLI